ncbi:MAG: toxin-antitoxin system HicB family antitoxin [Planctomycetaceae bacterium]
MPTHLTTKSPSLPKSFSHASAAVLHTAERLFATSPEWVVFFREVLGIDGIVSRTFGSGDARMRFECSPHYARIREMLDLLRSRERDRPMDREANRVVTVRMPRALHEALKAEAADHRMSINTLCISKLLKALDTEAAADARRRADPPEAVPAPKRAGRRPR